MDERDRKDQRTSTIQSVRDVTYQLLREFGMTTFFGNVGSTEETFLKNFPSDFRYVLALQEASVIGMADGFSQATGLPALVNVHTGAGLGNAMGNLITASLNKTPLIVTAGQQTREMLLMEPFLTNVEATMLPRPWVKWAYRARPCRGHTRCFHACDRHSSSTACRSVFLSLPLDDWDKPCAGPAVVRTVSRRFAPDGARLAEFAKALTEASSPVLIYGSAIDRGNGWSEAVAFAEALGAPVWAAPISERAPFPENHPLYSGGLPFAIDHLSQKLEGHDVALMVGAPVFRYYPYVPGPYLPRDSASAHFRRSGRNGAGPGRRQPTGGCCLSLASLTDPARRTQAEDWQGAGKGGAWHGRPPVNRAKMSRTMVF